MNTTNKITDWYTSEFLSKCLGNYLNGRGFGLREPEEQEAVHFSNALVSTRLLSKEVIEIRGALTEIINPETEKHAEKKAAGFRRAMNFLIVIILSPVSFFTPSTADKISRCFCLPDLEQNRKILEKVNDYFISNELRLKIYLINQDGFVDVVYLNPNKKQA